MNTQFLTITLISLISSAAAVTYSSTFTQYGFLPHTSSFPPFTSLIPTADMVEVMSAPRPTATRPQPPAASTPTLATTPLHHRTFLVLAMVKALARLADFVIS